MDHVPDVTTPYCGWREELALLHNLLDRAGVVDKDRSLPWSLMRVQEQLPPGSRGWAGINVAIEGAKSLIEYANMPIPEGRLYEFVETLAHKKRIWEFLMQLVQLLPEIQGIDQARTEDLTSRLACLSRYVDRRSARRDCGRLFFELAEFLAPWEYLDERVGGQSAWFLGRGNSGWADLSAEVSVREKEDPHPLWLEQYLTETTALARDTINDAVQSGDQVLVAGLKELVAGINSILVAASAILGPATPILLDPRSLGGEALEIELLAEQEYRTDQEAWRIAMEWESAEEAAQAAAADLMDAD